jgi:hypothetical protein
VFTLAEAGTHVTINESIPAPLCSSFGLQLPFNVGVLSQAIVTGLQATDHTTIEIPPQFISPSPSQTHTQS